MTRRELAQTAAWGLGAMLCSDSQASSNRQASPSSVDPEVEGLTRYVVTASDGCVAGGE